MTARPGPSATRPYPPAPSPPPNHPRSPSPLPPAADGSRAPGQQSAYLTKAGGWVRANVSGFLVRENPGPGGLALYHADDPRGPDTARVVRAPLAAALRSGRYRLAVVRRLHHRLSPDREALVAQFAALNVGREAPRPPAPALVLQANTAGASATAYEHLACSEFVATMLHLAGLVEPTKAPRDFAASDPKGHLVGPPICVKVAPPPGGGARGAAAAAGALPHQSSSSSGGGGKVSEAGRAAAPDTPPRAARAPTAGA